MLVRVVRGEHGWRCVLFWHEGKRDMLVVGTESSEWGHDNSVLQLQVAQLQGLEEVRRHGGYNLRSVWQVDRVFLRPLRQLYKELCPLLKSSRDGYLDSV